MGAGLQLELLGDNVSPLFGMRVKFDTDRSCPHCKDKIAVIGRTTGPHFAELKCATCGCGCGWLSKSTAIWLTTIINKFGAPATPIVLRHASRFTHKREEPPDNAGISTGRHYHE